MDKTTFLIISGVVFLCIAFFDGIKKQRSKNL